MFTDGTEGRSGGQSLHILIAPVKSIITLTQDQEAPFSHHRGQKDVFPRPGTQNAKTKAKKKTARGSHFERGCGDFNLRYSSICLIL